jgi:hypothetical protein
MIPRGFFVFGWFPVFVASFSFTAFESRSPTTHHAKKRNKSLARLCDTVAEANVAVPSTTCRTPFQIFHDGNLVRIEESDHQGFNQLSENVVAHTVLQPIVSWSEIQWLASNNNNTESIMEEREELAHRVSSAGGFLLLELEESQECIVQDMWTTLHSFFDSNRTDLLNADQLHHQALAREGGDHENSGYKFVQTYNSPGDVVLPTTIQGVIGNSGITERGITDSFLLFADIASKVTSVVVAGALEEDPVVVQSLVDHLLHNATTRFACSNHRLSRYILMESEADPLKESLKPHCDWTLMTPIPLSATPGLQLWKPNSKQWIALESLVMDLPLPRTRYVVVLAGKWIELLTNQTVVSCIHRVVTQTSQEARLSAPFFLRPKESVFESLTRQFNDPEEATEDMSTEEAMIRMHSMFQGSIDRTKDSSNNG